MNIKDFKWTEKRFGTRFANILKKLGGLSKDGTDGSIEYKDEQGNVTKLVTDSNFSSLLAKNGLIEVKWQELKDKRDNGELTPGSLYRITDYQCTTTQENTKSAGHQFDIVLLALSENKLAEEGWAMEHPTDVYDVTFADGVTKKCWVYKDTDCYNLVEINSLLGCKLSFGSLEIDEVSKVAICDDFESEELTFDIPDLTYNYFQNSNLSAWKVWYCLDNDTSRFAWADDSVDVEFSFIGTSNGSNRVVTEQNIAERAEVEGTIYYKFKAEGSWEIWVNTLDIEIGSKTYTVGGPSSHLMATEVGEILSIGKKEQLPNGRGVIYRLIDEWNNDVAYDFKNIQFVRKLTDGALDTSTGIDTWCYTFNGWNGDNSACVDATTDITLGFNDINNNISFITSLGDNVFLGECNNIKIMDTQSGLITLSNCFSTTLIATFIFELADENGAIYIANKKVLTEE